MLNIRLLRKQCSAQVAGSQAAVVQDAVRVLVLQRAAHRQRGDSGIPEGGRGGKGERGTGVGCVAPPSAAGPLERSASLRSAP